MAGAHIEREALAEQTGLTTAERDRLIAELYRKGWSQHKIGARLGISQPGVHYALKRLAGQPRTQTRYRVCQGCGGTVTIDELGPSGLCDFCEE